MNGVLWQHRFHSDGGVTMKHWEYGLSKATREDVLDRLYDIGGHIRGIETMVDRNAGSLEVVHQMSAIQGAL